MHKAHEKIYLQVDPDGESCDPEQYDLEDDCTWCKDQINENDVAYIRADLVETLRKRNDDLVTGLEACDEPVESLRQQLADMTTHNVMLREALEFYRSKLTNKDVAGMALAATEADLGGLIVCEKGPVAEVDIDDGFYWADICEDQIVKVGEKLYRAKE